MNVHFKITQQLLDAVRSDLRRPHPFAYERVGWISAGASRIGKGSLMLLAHGYNPVADEDYVDDRSVGAMMGSEAIRKALQRCYQNRSVALHVHLHDHYGQPDFSGTDNRENAKFVPDFFNVAAHAPHGALVLSDDHMAGNLWRSRNDGPIRIGRFSVIGAPLWMAGDK